MAYVKEAMYELFDFYMKQQQTYAPVVVTGASPSPSPPQTFFNQILSSDRFCNLGLDLEVVVVLYPKQPNLVLIIFLDDHLFLRATTYVGDDWR